MPQTKLEENVILKVLARKMAEFVSAFSIQLNFCGTSWAHACIACTEPNTLHFRDSASTQTVRPDGLLTKFGTAQSHRLFLRKVFDRLCRRLSLTRICPACAFWRSLLSVSIKRVRVNDASA